MAPVSWSFWYVRRRNRYPSPSQRNPSGNKGKVLPSCSEWHTARLTIPNKVKSNRKWKWREIYLGSARSCSNRNFQEKHSPHTPGGAEGAATSQVRHIDGNILGQALALAPDHPASQKFTARVGYESPPFKWSMLMRPTQTLGCNTDGIILKNASILWSSGLRVSD